MALALPSVGTAQAATRALAPDSATILVSLLARPVGTETYVVRDAGRGSRLTAAVRIVALNGATPGPASAEVVLTVR